MPDLRSDAGLEEARLDEAIVAEQVSLLVHNRVDLPINLVIAGFVFAVLRKLYPTWLALLWISLFSIVIVLRLLSRRHYRLTAPGPEMARTWGRAFTANAFVTSLLWGMTGSAVLLTSDPASHVFIILALSGMMAGGVMTNSAYMPTIVAFTVPTLLPIIAILLVSIDKSQRLMGMMMVLFATITLVTGWQINRSIIENFRLRIIQDVLLGKLRASEAGMADVQKIALVGAIEFDPANDRVTLAAQTCDIIGVDPGSFKATFGDVMARVHEDDRAAVRRIAADCRLTGAGRDFDCRVVMDDGAIKIVHTSIRSVIGSDNRPVRFVATLQDITERERIEADRTSLAAIVESSKDAIVSETSAGIIATWNHGAERLFGYPASEAIGHSIRMIIPEDRRDEIDLHLNSIRLGQAIEPFDTERLRKDGTRIPVSVAVSLDPATLGRSAGASFIARDNTERQVASDALAYRDRMLHAVTIAAGLLVKAKSINAGITDALHLVGESLGADRMIVTQVMSDQVRSASSLSGVWQAQDIDIPINASTFADVDTNDAAISAWIAPLLARKPVITHVASSRGVVHAMLERMHVQSTMIVPIFVGEKLSAWISADSCRRARDWTAGETNILEIFGEIVGSLMIHADTRTTLERSEGLFRAITTAAQDAIIMVDAGARISLWNPAAERILGYSSAEAEGQQIHSFLAPASFRKSADFGMDTFLTTGQGAAVGKTTELAALRKDGAEISVELSLAGTRLEDGWGAIGILRDTSQRKEADDKLQFANILLKTQMEASLDGILIVDASLKIISFNARFADMWNIPLDDLTNADDAVVLEKVASAVKDQANFIARVQYLYDSPEENSHDEYETTDERSIERYTIPLTTKGGKYLGRAWFFRDVTDKKRAAANALRMARYDVLTGLANRAVFIEALQHAIATAKRSEISFAVIYLDLDHFKDVNDTLGHPVGDELLVKVADLLRSNARETDTIARFGGDEFAVVVADIKGPADAASFAEKLLAAFVVPIMLHGSEIHTGASIGIATYGADAPDAEALLSHADVALYRAKSEGRGSYRFFTAAMDIEVQLRVKLGAELRSAVDSGQLFLMYQPQIAIDSGRITGIEALVRWRHPQRGVLLPDTFIPIAEQIGMITKLGHWVVWEACRQGKQWIDAGVPPVRIAVNVSALQFRAPVALEKDIVSVLAETGFPAHLLELELTESVLMEASREHSDVLTRLQASGITTAIDDFGTGYSSLDYLRQFPSNRIKIAQIFVRNLETKPSNAAIIRATIGLARALDIGLIAEGVETPEQARLLKSWGCDEVQGFLFAPPLTVENAEEVLRSGKIVRHDLHV